MSRACTSGRPALIIVENCRVKMTMSRILTDPPRFFRFAVPSSILTTFSLSWRSCLMTSSRLGASMVADLRSPLTARAVYVNVGIRPLRGFGGAIGHTSPVGMAHCQMTIRRLKKYVWRRRGLVTERARGGARECAKILYYQRGKA